MGRESRRVPVDWEHPKDERGHHQPLYDQPFEQAFAEWSQARQDWLDDKDGERTRVQNKYYDGKDVPYERWNGTSPDPDYYRPAWPTDTVLGYCMYETVSEGTPVSPAFATLQELEDWLVEEGTDRANAKAFCKHGWAPSFVMSPQIGFKSGLDAAGDIYRKDD